MPDAKSCFFLVLFWLAGNTKQCAQHRLIARATATAVWLHICVFELFMFFSYMATITNEAQQKCGMPDARSCLFLVRRLLAAAPISLQGVGLQG